MPSILIGNSYSRLSEFPPEVVEIVKMSLTYKDQEVYFERQRLLRQLHIAKNTNNLRYYYGIKKSLEELPPAEICLLHGTKFPTGLLDVVQDTLERSYFASYETLDKRSRPDPYELYTWRNKPSLRYYQKDMVKAGTEEGRGVFSASIGSGKTLVAVQLTKDLGVNTVFIAPSVALREQTFEVYKYHFGPKYVMQVDTKSLDKKKLKPIRIVTVQTLASLQKKGRLQEVFKDVDCFIIDEAHRQAAASYTNLLKELDHVYFRYSLTGTFLRNDSKTLDLHSITSKVLYHYPPKQATQEGYIVPVKYFTKKLPGSPSRSYQQEYRKNYCGSQVVLEWVADLIDDVIPKDNQVLILVEQKEKAGKILSEWLNYLQISHTYISGDDNKKLVKDVIRDFNDKKIRILIATKILGEGVDLVSAQHLLNLQGGKGVTKFVQAIGRAVRPHPDKDCAYVYDIIFESTNYLYKHAEIRMRTFHEWFEGDIKSLD
jgi:superfamily II DNA or RNA helicase